MCPKKIVPYPAPLVKRIPEEKSCLGISLNICHADSVYLVQKPSIKCLFTREKNEKIDAYCSTSELQILNTRGKCFHISFYLPVISINRLLLYAKQDSWPYFVKGIYCSFLQLYLLPFHFSVMAHPFEIACGVFKLLKFKLRVIVESKLRHIFPK